MKYQSVLKNDDKITMKKTQFISRFISMLLIFVVVNKIE